MAGMIRLCLILWLSMAMILSTSAFTLVPLSSRSPTTVCLHAKKKRSANKKGFGKTPSPSTAEQSSPPLDPAAAEVGQAEMAPPSEASTLFQSAEGVVDTSVPVVDESLPPEERTKQILREKYGLKTLAEQRMTEKQVDNYREQQRKQAEWKKAAEEGKDLDLIAMIPAPVLSGIDLFLKGGVAVTGFLFIVAGLAITAEAWSKTSGQPLPPNIDDFIVTTVEPNFTTGLFVLLGFSVSLGVLAAAQLGSDSSQYKED